MVLIINLNTTVDKTIIINDYKIDNIFRPGQVIEAGGGKGLNAARVLNTLGIENTIIGFVGGEKTNTILDTLKKERMNFVPVPIYGNSRTCTLIIDKKNNTETMINENGPEISKFELNSFLKMFNKVFTEKIKYLVISGSLPPGVPADFYAKLIKFAKKRKVFTIVDTSDKPLYYSIKAKPDLIKPNQHELQKVFKIKKADQQVLKSLLFKLSKQGVKYPIITLGKQGSIALDPLTNKIIKAVPPEIKKISTIGSGDSFLAGLIYSFINNYNFTKSLQMATAAAAANALKIGAGILKKGDIFSLFNKVNIKSSQ